MDLTEDKRKWDDILIKTIEFQKNPCIKLKIHMINALITIPTGPQVSVKFADRIDPFYKKINILLTHLKRQCS